MITEYQHPLDIFMDVFTQGGTLVQQCGFCGRTHFATHNTESYYEPGELEKLREGLKQQPDKFVPQDCSWISSGQLAGRVAVWGCPCVPEKVSPYMAFIIDHRVEILDFLKQKAAAELSAAKTEIARLEGV